MFEWWHWIILGLCLAMAELAIPAFFIIWFGTAALLVGVALLVFPELGLAAQLLLWAGLSIALVLLWFRYLKPRTLTAVGTSAGHVIGEVGLLLGELAPDARSQVRFQKPVLGADVWECYSDIPLPAGARVRVVAVEGSFVKVEAAK